MGRWEEDWGKTRFGVSAIRQRLADYTLRTADVGDNRSAVLQRTRGNAGLNIDRKVTVLPFS